VTREISPLDGAIDGRVILPSSAEYATAKNLFKIAARSGGHSYIGASAANGAMVIDTSFTFRTSPVTDRDVVTLAFPAGAIEQAILGWHEWLRTADRTIWGMVNAAGRPPAEVRPERIDVLGRQLLRNRPATTSIVRPTDLVELS
jgi:hypothetical protein